MTQHLETSPLQNFRDLGGTPVANGHIKPGLAWRSDDISLIPTSQANELYNNGLRKILDLRSRNEADVTGRGVTETMPIEYRALPFSKDLEMPGMSTSQELTGNTAQQIGEGYVAIAIGAANEIVTALRELISTDGATVFHCSAGKDRTGILAATILSLLGAEPDVIVDDYTKTNANVPGIMNRLAPVFSQLIPTGGAYGDIDIKALMEQAGPLMGAPAEAMETMLSQVADKHGGFAALLKEHGGLTDQDIQALRTKLVGA